MKHVRLFALMTAALLLFSLIGCADKPTEEPRSELTVYEGEKPVDLQGYEFTVIDFWTIHWNRDQESHTPYTDAWMKVMDEVEGLYNCTITPTYISAGEIFDKVQPEVAAGEKGFDLICTTQWGIGYFIGGGYLMDLNKLDVDWTAPYWNQNIRNCTTVEGRTYAGGGPFIFDSQSTWMIYYNNAIWQELGFPNPYRLVRDGKWTIDRMTEYASKAVKDLDGDGAVSSEEDRWGLVCAEGDWIRSNVLGMEGHYFNTDPVTGRVKLACDNTHTFDIVEKLHNLMNVSGSFFLHPEHNETQRVQMFVDGKTLFYAYMPGMGQLKNMEDDWGVLPLPKFDENQKEYLTGIDQNAFVFGVTATNENTRELSILLKALGLHAQILENIYWPDYKETYWRHEEEDTAIMRDYVVGHGLYDIALLMRNCVGAFWAPVSGIEKNVLSRSSDFASYIDAVGDQVQTLVDEYFGY